MEEITGWFLAGDHSVIMQRRAIINVLFTFFFIRGYNRDRYKVEASSG